MNTALEVRGFKAIRDSGFLGLGLLTLLIGRTGSGKSAPLEALQWLQVSLGLGLRVGTQRQAAMFEGLLHRGAHRITLVVTLGPEGDVEVSYVLEVKADASGNPVIKHEPCREGSDTTAPLTIQSREVAGSPVVRGMRVQRRCVTRIPSPCTT
ncbi:hypothetical protein [Chondromyces apiculatus]|uniref:Rad50/SbcC-type AAA domain-containing protein n=1 Tax=Chondromyces apiculatus DSM 436 TaxID=1192034 RepID=A0A017THF2_9BACT|nr:hypothetical protein [Chondromyces apiculatus]EYF08669.1 Hypothetical protein CAP_2530 [Chondromyces apiculatus DSM 436]